MKTPRTSTLQGHPLARAVTASGGGVWWRVHPRGRDFSVEDATSKPFNRDVGSTQVGYSCFAHPWHLWGYLYSMGWPLGDADVLKFSGRATGEKGSDGEDLVVPDFQIVERMSLDQFDQVLIGHPLPPAPIHKPWGVPPTWEGFASKLREGVGPVSDHLLRTQRRQASVTAANAPPVPDGSQVIYRGICLDVSSIADQLDDLLAPAMTMDEIDKRFKIGRLLVELASSGSHWDSEMTLGRHWTTSRDMATKPHCAGGSTLVVFEARYEAAGANPAYKYTTESLAYSESEINLLPGARVTVIGVYLNNYYGATRSENLLDAPIQSTAKTASQRITAYRGIPVSLEGIPYAQLRELFVSMSEGDYGPMKQVVTERLSGGGRVAWWNGGSMAPGSGAGLWWSSSRDVAHTYALRRGELVVPVVLNAEIDEKTWEPHESSDAQGTYWWRVEPGLPLTIVKAVAHLPIPDTARRYVESADGQGQWAKVDEFRNYWNGEDYHFFTLDTGSMPRVSSRPQWCKVGAVVPRIEAVTLDYERGTNVEARHPVTGELMGLIRFEMIDGVAEVIRAQTTPGWRGRGINDALMEWLHERVPEVTLRLSKSDDALLQSETSGR